MLLVRLTFPGSPNSAKSLKFEGFVHLPKDGHAGLLTILDYLTLSGENLFVTNVSTGTVYRIALRGEALPATSDVSMFQLEPAAHRVVIDPVTRLAYVTRSEANTVDIFDPAAMRLATRIPVADDPDRIFYISSSPLIYVASGDAKVGTLILKWGPGAALVDSDRLQLRRPFERQIDPVEQRLGVELSRLTSPADCLDDAGCCECQARETLDVTHSDALAPCDLR